MQSPLCILVLLACSTIVAARECDSQHERCAVETYGLLQRRKAVEGALAALGIHAAEVKPGGTVDLLLSEMNAFVDKKGDTGIDPDEIEHIHGIKAMIDNTILPTILEEVEDDRKELEALYEEIVACHDHAHEVDNITRERHENVIEKSDEFKQCAQQEEEIATQKEEVCTTLNRTRVTIRLPGEEDFPPPNVPDEEMIRYLKMMDEFFCGTYETFEEEWHNCTELESNYTILHQQCMTLQKQWEEIACSWKTTVKTSCETYDTCWTDAVKKYNKRKGEIMELHVSRAGEYEGATKIECLWSAWVYEGEPCTVNKTRIRECHEFEPNYTNVTIEYPQPPTPPSCDASNVEIDVCSDDWFSGELHYIGLTPEHVAEIKSYCTPCLTDIVTSAPEVIATVNLVNAEHTGGDSYMKVEGTMDCDASIESEDADVYGISVTPSDLMGKIIIELATTEGTTYTMEMQDRMCTIGTDVFMYNNDDTIGCSFSAGQILFTKNGELAAQDVAPEGVVSGRAKVSICSAKGTTVTAKFEHIA
mmetsp:Transcript_20849/g.47917  ORF Transcript_20849/g.47917 Transcript_20849/m.47917 type:complete len:533 (+) Transcript_20849:62-1660(+)